MIKKARLEQVRQIQSLVKYFASKDLMLDRSLNELYENLRDFWVWSKNKKVYGCAALHMLWDGLAEIKSVAVSEKHHKENIGTKLIEQCLKEAKQLGIKRVFVLTYAPNFFKKFGFKRISKEKLPHKIWAECINCPKFPDCNEVALIKNIAR
ncbi:MAG: N-acetyltransferase [Candidatus Gygaella obscura]|nr:N-acetyltransferase [Candidatus Gygaella obscura]